MRFINRQTSLSRYRAFLTCGRQLAVSTQTTADLFYFTIVRDVRLMVVKQVLCLHLYAKRVFHAL